MGSTLCVPKDALAKLANAMVSPFALTPFTAVMLSMMFALSDDQLALVMMVAVQSALTGLIQSAA